MSGSYIYNMHWNFFSANWGSWDSFAGLGMFVMLPLLVWSLAWKGAALWKAARAGRTGWFVALLLVNTAGILDILYIYVFSKKQRPSQK